MRRVDFDFNYALKKPPGFEAGRLFYSLLR